MIHAAALKHVLICEQNPAEAVRTNILERKTSWIWLSVLKLKNDYYKHGQGGKPSSTMGASKYIAEKLTLTEIRQARQNTPAYDLGCTGKPWLRYPNMHKSIAKKIVYGFPTR